MLALVISHLGGGYGALECVRWKETLQRVNNHVGTSKDREERSKEG